MDATPQEIDDSIEMPGNPLFLAVLRVIPKINQTAETKRIPAQRNQHKTSQEQPRNPLQKN
jgi:hypothetical protein